MRLPDKSTNICKHYTYRGMDWLFAGSNRKSVQAVVNTSPCRCTNCTNCARTTGAVWVTWNATTRRDKGQGGFEKGAPWYIGERGHGHMVVNTSHHPRRGPLRPYPLSRCPRIPLEATSARIRAFSSTMGAGLPPSHPRSDSRHTSDPHPNSHQTKDPNEALLLRSDHESKYRLSPPFARDRSNPHPEPPIRPLLRL